MGRLSRPALTPEGAAGLRLRPAGPDDAALLASLDTDPEVMRHLTGRAVPPEQAEPAWRAALATRTDDERGLGYWAGFDPDGGFVGWWGLHGTDDHEIGELGYRLARGAWGRGLATVGARALVEYAFGGAHEVDGPTLVRVRAETMAINTASRRVLEKAGLRHVDTYLGTWDEPLPGSEQGEVVYEAVGEAGIAVGRLELEPLRGDDPEHVDLLVGLDADPEVLRHIFGRALTRAEVLERLPARVAAGVGGLGFWLGFERPTRAFAGWWCLIPDAGARSAEIGYRLPRSAWGRGLASEGAIALRHHAFDVARLDRIWATTASTNTGSQAVLGKVGLQLVGRETGRWPAPFDDRDRDDLRYELVRP